MGAKKTQIVIFQAEEIKVRSRCEDFGKPTDCKNCRKCCEADNQIGFACHVRQAELNPVEVVEEVAPKPTLEELKKMFSEEELKMMLQELIGEPEPENAIVEQSTPHTQEIKRRKGTKLDTLKALVFQGIFTKEKLADQLKATVNTINVYLTKLRKEFGMVIDTPKGGVVSCKA